MKTEEDDSLPHAWDESSLPKIRNAKLEPDDPEPSSEADGQPSGSSGISLTVQSATLSTHSTYAIETSSIATHLPANLPTNFSPDWSAVDLKLPSNLRTSTLPVNYVEMLKKIRSLECERCRLDHAQGDPPLCVQDDRGSGTWKCKRCFDRHLSSCEWMLKCVDSGLGTRPPVLRTSHQRQISATPYRTSTSSGSRASSSVGRTRASLRSAAVSERSTPSSPVPTSDASHSLSDLSIHIPPEASSSLSVSRHAATSQLSRHTPTGPDWSQPLRDLERRLEDRHRETTEFMTALLQEMHELRQALPRDRSGDGDSQTGKGKERAA
ncbi:hypothetical protein C8Q76DRAFT_801794 [Earliella scabrosa]|nr:hypothetical protein C8Q76DRAFT_801794 [Earliella scabrosa]